MADGSAGAVRRRKLPPGGIASVVRGGGRSGAGGGRDTSLKMSDTAGLGMMPAEIDEAFKALIEETLEPEKQEALMAAYAEEKDPRQKYNMLLEFSSYLRQSHMRDEDQDPYDPKSKAAPRGGGGGGGSSAGGNFGGGGGGNVMPPGPGRPRAPMSRMDDEDDDVNLCWEIVRVILLVGAVLGFILGLAWYINKSVEESTRASLEPIQPLTDEERAAEGM